MMLTKKKIIIDLADRETDDEEENHTKTRIRKRIPNFPKKMKKHLKPILEVDNEGLIYWRVIFGNKFIDRDDISKLIRKGG